MNEKVSFKTYDYLKVVVGKDMEAITLDTYESLGWELTESESAIQTSAIRNSVKLSFKRDRKIQNKTELIEIQEKTSDAFASIGKLEKQKTASAKVKSIAVGLFGCIWLALSVFMITGYIEVGELTMLVQALFGAIGLVLWVFPYFVYKSTVRMKIQEIEPIIDNAYDRINDLSEQANSLLRNSNRMDLLL